MAVENRKKENGHREKNREVTTPLVLHRQETEARGGSRSGVSGEVSLYDFMCVRDWRTSKGLARWGKREEGRYGERPGDRGGGRHGKNREGEGAGWPFFAEHRHSLCILSSFKSTYTICSCRLVDILVYVHSSERTHAKSIIGETGRWGGAGGDVESCKGAFAVFNLWGSCDENCFEAVFVFKGEGRLKMCLARDGVTEGRNKWKM